MNANNKDITSAWFKQLRDQICTKFEAIETEYANIHSLTPSTFNFKPWDRPEGGGGVIGIMKGNVFEKVGVNISTVYGEFSPEFSKQIPGTENDPKFYATGISLVSHMRSPLVPAAHFNTRYICTTKEWFGGGGDLTQIFPNELESNKFHKAFKSCCDTYNSEYYDKFKKQCDDYFYLPHRKEPRGIGGIFYDYFNSGDFSQDLSFTQNVGRTFADVYDQIIREKMYQEWTPQQREEQLIKRGRYVEFNLLYDRGTKFGLMTGGNIEAILMSLPPEVKWP